MGMLKEFRDFAVKGNMIDMAVGIIMGAAFGGLVQSMVKDVLMPPVGLLLGGFDFSKEGMTLRDASEGREALIWTYGNFIQLAINFLIVAFCVFVLVKAINTLKKKEEAAPAAPPKQEVLLTEIRDLLKKA